MSPRAPQAEEELIDEKGLKEFKAKVEERVLKGKVEIWRHDDRPKSMDTKAFIKTKEITTANQNKIDETIGQGGGVITRDAVERILQNEEEIGLGDKTITHDLHEHEETSRADKNLLPSVEDWVKRTELTLNQWHPEDAEENAFKARCIGPRVEELVATTDGAVTILAMIKETIGYDPRDVLVPVEGGKCAYTSIKQSPPRPSPPRLGCPPPPLPAPRAALTLRVPGSHRRLMMVMKSDMKLVLGDSNRLACITAI